MEIILKGLRLLNPEQDLDINSDILIKDGIIEKIENLDSSKFVDAKVFDFSGKVCVPGLYDMHVHLREPGGEDKETVISGSNSAAAGGFTGIACMPNTNPAIDSAEVVKFIADRAKDHLVDVNPIGAVTKGRKGEALAPMLELSDAGAVGFSDDGTAVKTASLLRNALEYAKMIDSPIIEHCEDESLAGGSMNESFVSTELGLPSIPTVAEDLIVMRGILLAEYTGGKIHIAHISSKRSVELVREAKLRGVDVTAEAAPHHFTLTDDCVKAFDTNYKMNPPLRQQKDVDEIIKGLQDGTIDCIASDHAPHSIEDKELEYIYAPNGIVGLETQLGLTLTELYHKGKLTLEQVVEKLSINPRRVLNLEIPQIAVGEKANFTIIDLDLEFKFDIKNSKSRSKNSPFNGRELKGKSVAVINNSQMYFDGEFNHI
ncbi:MAG: dihydroorotase [Bacteroidetes bacterium]|nr:dihydroorotase [Bacteroidota bacterium]MBU1116572.1 dihydroorotase [Bacteroidota bacterium]MBU1797538.1 dihydroorotase [Bacteroidota bacterium]